MQTLLKKITVLTIRQQMIVVAVIIFLLSYLFYITLIEPQSDQITEMETQLASEQVKLKIVDGFSVQHPLLETYLTELDRKIAQTNELLPNDPAMGPFILQIQQAAREAQVELIHIALGTYLNKTGYYEIPVELGIRGNFFKVAEFIKRCESLARLTSIATVNMQTKDGLLECKIPLVIYTFGVAPVQAGAAPSQPAKTAAPPAAPAVK